MWFPHFIEAIRARRRADRHAIEIARRAFEEKYPELDVLDVGIRARELDRTVLTVFWRRGALVSRPASYKLFAVTKPHTAYRDFAVSEIFDEQYALRGRK